MKYYFAEKVDFHNGVETEDVDVSNCNTVLTSMQQAGSDETVSGELENSEVGDNELDRNFIEESHQMDFENNNAPHLTQGRIVDYDETSDGDNR